MVLCLLLLSRCGAPVPPPTTVAHRPEPPPRHDGAISALLVAGDNSIDVFDNAIAYLKDQLVLAGVPAAGIQLLTPREPPSAAGGPATLAQLTSRLALLKPAPRGSCFVYLTSHGIHEDGVYLAAEQEVLAPALLDGVLTAGCGAVPTVLIVSACYAGQFLQPDLLRPNRIILAAARADRTSFGCAAGFTYTFFDECLLGALGRAADWHVVFERTRGCVAERERQVDAEPSEPQAWFGPDADVLPPWHPRPGEDPLRIEFTAGPGRYAPALVPFGARERHRLRSDIALYATLREPKAMAIATSGLVVPIGDAAGVATADADAVARLALERCEYLSGGACILFARDDRMTELLPSGLAPFHPPILVRTGRVTPQTVPFIRAGQRPEVAVYLSRPGPKALALSPGLGDMAAGYGADPAAARQAALAGCESGLGDCVIYAEGDEAVLGWNR